MIVEGVDIDEFVKVANSNKIACGMPVIMEARSCSDKNFIRWDKILDAAKDKLDDEVMGKLLYILWQAWSWDMDGSIMYDLFKGANKQYLMTDEERKIFKNLPNRVTIYRGSQDISKGTNISWTLDYERAKWFAAEVLVKTEVDKSIIAAYFNREKEVICPPELFSEVLKDRKSRIF